MAEIFLYTPEARLNSMHLKALRQAGVVPIKVADLNSVKQLARPMAMPDFQLDLLAFAAFKTIKEYGQYAHAAFGKNIAEMMTKRATSAIEVRSGETPKSGSTEGESAPEGDAQPKGGSHAS